MDFDLAPYRGIDGFQSKVPDAVRDGTLAYPTDSIDVIQLLEHIRYCEATRDYLYGRAPRLPRYTPGSRPRLEALAAEALPAGRGYTDLEKVKRLLRIISERVPHVYVCRKTQEWTAGYITEERMLDRGFAYCNELARLFCSLCAIAGVPARMLFLYNKDRVTGHVVAEAWIDGAWAFCDPSINYLPRPLADGRRVNGELGKLDPEARGILLEFDFRTLLVDYDVGDDYYADLFDEFAIYEYEALEGSE